MPRRTRNNRAYQILANTMKILFLHGWKSVPGGVKPTYLKDHGHEVINPKLPDEDFEEAVRIATPECWKEGGIVPPHSVVAPDAALGSVPTVALSSALNPPSSLAATGLMPVSNKKRLLGPPTDVNSGGP